MAGPQQALVFVVDDDDAVRDSLKVLLESHGFSVSDFGSAHEFLAAYRRHPRCCLILDLHLPVMGGLDFLSSRAARKLDLPVIMITGRGDEATRERAFEIGAVAFLEKPVADDELIAAIERALIAPAATLIPST